MISILQYISDRISLAVLRSIGVDIPKSLDNIHGISVHELCTFAYKHTHFFSYFYSEYERNPESFYETGIPSYKVPVALKLFNSYKNINDCFGFSSARDLALEIKKNLDDMEKDILGQIQVNVVGYIFVEIRESFLVQGINQILSGSISNLMKESNRTKSQPRTIAVDFSSPNIAKEMHVGHLRSTIMGGKYL